MYDSEPEPYFMLTMNTFLAAGGVVTLAAMSITAFAQGRGGAPPPMPMPAALQNYQTVTAERTSSPDGSKRTSPVSP